MHLNNLYLTSMSIFAILASLFVVVIGILLTIFIFRAIKLAKKAEDLADYVKNMVSDVGDSIKETSASIESFAKSIFTIDAIKNTILEIIQLIKNRKGEEDEK